MTEDFQLQVQIEPSLQGLVDGISFETGLTRQQAADPHLYAYEHHGSGFTEADPGALTHFLEDLVMGRPMPLKFAAKSLHLDTLFAITLFLHRDLVTHPATYGIVSQVDFAHRRGLAGYAHIPSDAGQFFRFLSSEITSTQTKIEQGAFLRRAVGWIYEYVTYGNIPHVGSPPTVSVRSVGTNGFVVASTSSNLHAGWVELFRLGHLRGILYTETALSHVLIGRKSVYVAFNLSKAREVLNELENALGGTSSWEEDELWLKSPSNGTFIPVCDILEVLLRV